MRGRARASTRVAVLPAVSRTRPGWLPTLAQLRGASLSEGLRAGLACGAVVAASVLLGWPPLAWSAVAAFWACLVDPGGPLRWRIVPMASFTILGALIAGLGALLLPLGLPIALGVVFVGLAATAFVRVYGNAASLVGNLLGIDLILAVQRPAGSLHQALTLGGLFLIGAAWALLLTLVLWRLHPFEPGRQALGRVHRRLAGLTGDLQKLARSKGHAPARWEAHAERHRGAVREAIEDARTTIGQIIRSRGHGSLRGRQQLIQLETADQLFAALIALSEVLELDPASRDEPDVERFLRHLFILHVRLARAIETDWAAGTRHLLPRIEALARLEEGRHGAGTERTHRLLAVIVDRLRIAAGLRRPPDAAPATDDVTGAPPPWHRQVWSPLRANLQPSSLALQHALRLASVVTAAIGVTEVLHLPYAYWLTITAAAIMQPYFAATWERALQRSAGSVAGAAIAALVTLFVSGPLALTVIIVPLSVATMAVRSVSYGLFALLLTPQFVLMVDLALPGGGGLALAGLRALNSLLGGVVALAGSLLLWPALEPQRMTAALGEAMRAHACYARAVLGALAGEGAADAVDPGRRQAGLSSNNLEASLQRALLESGRPPPVVRAAMTADAALRRLAGTLTALALDPAVRTAIEPAVASAFARWTAASLEGMAAAVAAGGHPAPIEPAPDLPGAGVGWVDALARIGRQVDLLQGIVGRRH